MSEELPTIKEIAKRLNVSVSTVSRALNNHPRIGTATKQRVQQLARELGYEPNPKAIHFKQGKTYVLGVVLPIIQEDFFSQAVSGIEDAAIERGYTILFGQSHDDFQKEMNVVNAMKKQRVDGLLISLSKETNNLRHLADLEKYNIPVVYFDRVPKSDAVNKVYCNLYNGTVELIDWLFNHGKKRIAFINGPDELAASKERLQGYIEGISRKKLKVDMQLVERTDLTGADTHRAMKNLMKLKKPPAAVISFNDYVHLDAVQWAIKNKIEVNKDILFASYANISINKYTAFPPVASVDQSPYEQGAIATKMLMDLVHPSGTKKEKDVKPLKHEMQATIVLGEDL